MDSLYQRLKELDPDTFQKLCFHILKDRFPEMDIRQVDGQSGDKGLDLFCGNLRGILTIWQCKAFANGVGESQKSQIRESLKQALKQFKPRRWILCLSVDLNEKATAWFQKFQHSRRNTVEIGLFDASAIVHELLHNRAVRERYFPGYGIDIVEWKRAVTKSGELTDDELEQVTDSNVDEYLERLRERDARFRYEILFSDAPGVHDWPPTHPEGSLLALSFRTANKVLNMYARDPEILASYRPIEFTPKDSAKEKIANLLRTGRAQTLQSDEVENVRWNLPVLRNANAIGKDWNLELHSTVSKKKLIKWKVEFVSSGKIVEFSLVEFRVEAFGTEEQEFQSVSEHLAFSMRIISKKGVGMQFEMSEQFQGKTPKSVLRYLEARQILAEGGTVRLTGLEVEGTIELPPSRKVSGPETESERKFRRLVEIATLVNERLGMDIRMPSGVVDADFDAADFLAVLLNGEPIEVERIRLRGLNRPSDNEPLTSDLQSDLIQDVRISRERWEPTPWLFDIPINTGPYTILAGDAVIEDLPTTLARLQAAGENEEIEISIRPSEKVRIVLGNAIGVAGTK